MSSNLAGLIVLHMTQAQAEVEKFRTTSLIFLVPRGVKKILECYSIYTTPLLPAPAKTKFNGIPILESEHVDKITCVSTTSGHASVTVSLADLKKIMEEGSQ